MEEAKQKKKKKKKKLLRSPFLKVQAIQWQDSSFIKYLMWLVDMVTHRLARKNQCVEICLLYV